MDAWDLGERARRVAGGGSAELEPESKFLPKPLLAGILGHGNAAAVGWTGHYSGIQPDLRP